MRVRGVLEVGPSTMASTGHASWQKPHRCTRHVNVVAASRRLPSSRSSASMVIACAGQIASHSLHAMHRSSPVGTFEARASAKPEKPVPSRGS